MSQYTVLRDFYLAEFNIGLQPGMVFADGDTEPDVVAQLLASGVIADVNASAPVVEDVAVEEPDIDDDADDEDDE